MVVLIFTFWASRIEVEWEGMSPCGRIRGINLNSLLCRIRLVVWSSARWVKGLKKNKERGGERHWSELLLLLLLGEELVGTREVLAAKALRGGGGWMARGVRGEGLAIMHYEMFSLEH